jgi:hypothetical protein
MLGVVSDFYLLVCGCFAHAKDFYHLEETLDLSNQKASLIETVREAHNQQSQR